MATSELLLYGPTVWAVVATATNAVAAATQVAVADRQFFITGISFSTGSAPLTTGQTIQVLSGATVLDEFRVPAAQQDPLVVNYNPPLQCAAGVAASISVPALGAAVVVTVVIKGKTGMAR